jgi:hypothetical protein
MELFIVTYEEFSSEIQSHRFPEGTVNSSHIGPEII